MRVGPDSHFNGVRDCNIYDFDFNSLKERKMNTGSFKGFWIVWSG